MTSSGLGFIDEQLEDGGGLFSPGSTTPSINSVNSVSIDKLTNTGEIWAYNAATGKVQPTNTIRIDPTKNAITTTNNKMRLFETGSNTITLFQLNNTGDVQIQLAADTDNVNANENASILFETNGVLDNAYVGHANNDFTICSQGALTPPKISMYVSDQTFTNSSGVRRPVPPISSGNFPALSIDQTNIPEFRNGLTFGDSTLNYYDEFTTTATFRTTGATGAVSLTPDATLKFTVIGRMVFCEINANFDASAALASTQYIETVSSPIPEDLRPVLSSINSPCYYFEITNNINPRATVFGVTGRIRIYAGYDPADGSTATFGLNTIIIRDTVRWMI